MAEAESDKSALERWTPVIAVVIGVVTLVFGSGIVPAIWSSQKAELQEAQERIDQHLAPIRGKLHENEELYRDLTGANYAEPGWGIQESYYQKVRRDGEAPHRIMRVKIDSLVENNDQILTHLQAYEGQILTPEFREQAELFRRHAIRYRTRWREMSRAALEGAEIPVAEPVFPQDFPAAVEREIQAVRGRAS